MVVDATGSSERPLRGGTWRLASKLKQWLVEVGCINDAGVHHWQPSNFGNFLGQFERGQNARERRRHSGLPTV